MPNELVTLKPNVGADLPLFGGFGLYRLGMEVDWGDHVIDPSLATGPDVIGGVVGTRTRVSSEATIPVWVRGASATAYTAAAEALAEAANNLARHGGTISRQVDFGSGNLSEELECEVYACDLDPEDGWLQAHRLAAIVTLNVERGPAWLAAEGELATDATFTDSVKRLAYTAGGNLPGPARAVFTDNASTARRFVELGGAFEQTPQTVEYLASTFNLTGTAGVLGGVGSDTAAIGGRAINVTPVLPVWTTVGILEDLPHSGSYRIRLRTKGGEDDSQFTSRVVYRSGVGQWKDLGGRVETPDATNYYDLDCAALLKYDSAETIDVRVDVKSSAASSQTYSLNSLTITPTNHYSVSRGLPIEAPSAGAVAFDDFATLDVGKSLDDSDGAGTNRVAPAGGTWQEAGAGAAAEWLRSAGPGVGRRGANDGTSNIGTGHYAYLTDGTSATTYDDVEVVVDGVLRHQGATATETILGAVARFIDANNWLMAALRVRRKNDGEYIVYFAVYKRVAGTITQLDQVTYLTGPSATAQLTIAATATGAWEARTGSLDAGGLTLNLAGTDSALASPSGAIDEGKVGMYSLVQSSNTEAYTFATSTSAYGAATASLYTDVIRDDGIGVLTSENSYSAATGGTAPLDFTPQGSRLWIPPGAGEITAKVRSSDSDSEPDTGFDLDTGLTLYHRRAYATLSDALA